MSKPKILFVTQEMKPYTMLGEISDIVRSLPQHVQEKGMEIRILMPRFGTINERRHRLHEVVRLSGMNIIVDDEDFPLIIKVASLPGARMQVYFLDNEDFFKRKYIFTDNKDKFYADNAERMIFFCKGVVETVKKFGWPPDLIHCHGWMTSLIPFYLKKAYANEPLFKKSKVIYSAYNSQVDENFDASFLEKAQINQLKEEDMAVFGSDDQITLNKGAIFHSDAVIMGSEGMDIDEDMLKDKATLGYQDEDDRLAAYMAFYHELLDK